jgi:hypothetical protein
MEADGMERLEQTITTVEKLRTDLIFDDYFSEGCFDPLATLELLQALSLLESGLNGLRKAHLFQTRAIATTQRGI